MLFLTLALPIYGSRALSAPLGVQWEPFYMTPPNRRPFKAVIRQALPA